MSKDFGLTSGDLNEEFARKAAQHVQIDNFMKKQKKNSQIKKK